ncbi:hypothetical protein QVD17_30983 [Tagetes erecta]|uniref:Uncharacterized protein n=1 Tax=Tagetes erecta TaxID=13708 RepID=A0AAD8K8W9_TARER|nr:hypothetical protein QVD17_30983 [Tagetes erecta]
MSEHNESIKERSLEARSNRRIKRASRKDHYELYGAPNHREKSNVQGHEEIPKKDKFSSFGVSKSVSSNTSSRSGKSQPPIDKIEIPISEKLATMTASVLEVVLPKDYVTNENFMTFANTVKPSLQQFMEKVKANYSTSENQKTQELKILIEGHEKLTPEFIAQEKSIRRNE